MSRVALSVTIDFDITSKSDILSALLAHRERCLIEEPGTIQFEVLDPVDDPSKLFIFELYKDNESLAAHSAGPSIARFREEVKNKILDLKVYKCLLAHEV